MEGFLNKLANLTKEDDQYQVLAYAYLLLVLLHFRLCACDVRSFNAGFCSHGDRSIIDKSTADDLKWIIRIIDKDLRIKIGPKFVLGGTALCVVSLVVSCLVSCGHVPCS